MRFKRAAAALAAVVALTSSAFLYSSRAARGSDHQDSPQVVAQPGADITDVYLFPAPDNANNVVLAMNIHPLIPAGMSGKVTLDPSVLYEFKLSHGPLGTTAPPDTAIQVLAHGTGSSQTVSVYAKTAKAIYRPSTTGTLLGTIPFGKEWKLPDGIVAFAGPRADPFFFDLFQFFTILPDRNAANPRTGNALGTSTPTFNGYPKGSMSGPGGYACSTAPSTNALTQINGGFDVVSIVLEVPKTLLVAKGQSPIVHLWATTSVPYGGEPVSPTMAYHQIEVLSRPAVKELFEVFADHIKTNYNDPFNDPKIFYAVDNFMQHVAGRSVAISRVVRNVLYPNELSADLSQSGPAAYLGVETGGATGSKFGGRGLTDDVIDLSLGVVFGNTVPALGLAPDDGKENACLTNEHVASGQGGVQTQSAFPFLATPH